MKTFVITLSSVFPTTHPRKGKGTAFAPAFRNGQTCRKCKENKPALCMGECFSIRKIHTLRGNLPLWEKRIAQIQNGEAVLSVRQWAGTPYRSKQVELARLTAEDGVGIQKAVVSRSEWEEDDHKTHYCYWATVEGKEIRIDDIAKNDGFPDSVDYVMWFDPDLEKQNPDKDDWKHLELAIIHFTPFRY